MNSPLFFMALIKGHLSPSGSLYEGLKYSQRSLVEINEARGQLEAIYSRLVGRSYFKNFEGGGFSINLNNSNFTYLNFFSNPKLCKRKGFW